MSEESKINSTRRGVLQAVGTGATVSAFASGHAAATPVEEETTTIVTQIAPQFEFDGEIYQREVMVMSEDRLRGVSVLADEQRIDLHDYCNDDEASSIIDSERVVMTSNTTREFGGRTINPGLNGNVPISLSSNGAPIDNVIVNATPELAAVTGHRSTADEVTVQYNGNKMTVPNGEEKRFNFYKGGLDTETANLVSEGSGSDVIPVRGDIVVRHLGECSINVEQSD